MICLWLHSWGLKTSACSKEQPEIEADRRRQSYLVHPRWGSFDERHWGKSHFRGRLGSNPEQGGVGKKAIESLSFVYKLHVEKCLLLFRFSLQHPTRVILIQAVKSLCLLEMCSLYLSSTCNHPNPAKEEQNHTAHPSALSPLSCNTFSCCQLYHEGIEMVSLALVSYCTHLKQSKTHSRVIFPLILLSLAPMCSGFRKCQALSKLSSPRSSSYKDALMCWHSPMSTQWNPIGTVSLSLGSIHALMPELDSPSRKKPAPWHKSSRKQISLQDPAPHPYGWESATRSSHVESIHTPWTHHWNTLLGMLNSIKSHQQTSTK